MTGNITLKDIQPVIFEDINTMIEDLDQKSTTKVFASRINDTSQENDEDLSINAINTNRGSWRGKEFTTGLRNRDFSWKRILLML